MRLKEEFYTKSAVELAPKLLGKLLCRKIGLDIIRYRITETECYFGEEDSACHAHKGKTPRTKILYEQGGKAYVYLCYGIHNLFNVVTGEKDFPQAVLVRGIEGFEGPGKLTKFLEIDRSLNGENLINSDKLWLEDDGFVPDYKTGKRVGIDYATEEYKNKPWRFIAV
jgi:DNA-3-methyladenine glycosylase